MGILNFFRRKDDRLTGGPSAAAAKERLQVVLAHERTERAQPDYLPRMRRDILDVIGRYVSIDEERVHVHYQNQGTRSRLELDIELPVPQSQSRPAPAVAKGGRGFGASASAAISRG